MRPSTETSQFECRFRGRKNYRTLQQRVQVSTYRGSHGVVCGGQPVELSSCFVSNRTQQVQPVFGQINKRPSLAQRSEHLRRYNTPRMGQANLSRQASKEFRATDQVSLQSGFLRSVLLKGAAKSTPSTHHPQIELAPSVFRARPQSQPPNSRAPIFRSAVGMTVSHVSEMRYGTNWHEDLVGLPTPRSQ